MLEMNKVQLIGNLTRDPEVTHMDNAIVAKFGMAMSRRFKNKDGAQREETAFVDVEVWNKTAEFVEKFLKKGVRIYVEGRLKFDTWEAQDGGKRNKLSVTGSNVQFALPKSSGNQQASEPRSETQQQSPPDSQPAPNSNEPDDLPF